MFFADTHIHLLASQWQTPLAEWMAHNQTQGVSMWVQPGVRRADWPLLLKLADEQAGVYAAPGLHPAYAHEWTAAAAAQLLRLCQHPKVVAVGEIGLDGRIDLDLRVQEKVLREQLDLARQAGLPVLLHCQKKMDALLRLLTLPDLIPHGGILHGFSGSLEMARRAVDLGLLIGVGPVLLRSTARKLPGVIPHLPATSLVLETDAPDMTRDSCALLHVAARLAALRGWTLAETARITTQNARRLLHKEKEPARE